MRRVLLFVLVGVVLPVGPFAQAADLTTVLPAPGETPGWKLAETPREFAGPDLFELIDGGAELYHEFGFRRAVSARYEGAASATLQLEIYEMNTAEAAYGAYSMAQSGKGTPVDAGQAARLYDEYLLLWQGHHFVSLVASGRGAETDRELTALARAVAARLGVAGGRPKLLEQLPVAGLQDAKYFRGPVALSNLYVFGSGNVFAVREGVLGTYPALRLFVFAYASPADARTRLQSAAMKLAEDRAYSKLTQTPTSFQCRDADGNNISAIANERLITVRITPADAPSPTMP